MVLIRVREWEEAAVERKGNIQSGKLKQQLPEQAVEDLECQGKRKGWGKRKWPSDKDIPNTPSHSPLNATLCGYIASFQSWSTVVR